LDWTGGSFTNWIYRIYDCIVCKLPKTGFCRLGYLRVTCIHVIYNDTFGVFPVATYDTPPVKRLITRDRDARNSIRIPRLFRAKIQKEFRGPCNPILLFATHRTQCYLHSHQKDRNLSFLPYPHLFYKTDAHTEHKTLRDKTSRIFRHLQ